MSKAHYRRVELPRGIFPEPRHVEPGDMVQAPRSGVMTVLQVTRLGDGTIRISGRFQESGYLGTYTVEDHQDFSGWGFLERGEEV